MEIASIEPPDDSGSDSAPQIASIEPPASPQIAQVHPPSIWDRMKSAFNDTHYGDVVNAKNAVRAGRAVLPDLATANDLYQKAEPYTRPYVNAPVTGVGGLIALGQGKGLQEAAQGIRQGKTAGDYVTESIPEPQSPSVAANVAGNVGREALGGAANLGIYAGAFEAPGGAAERFPGATKGVAERFGAPETSGAVAEPAAPSDSPQIAKVEPPDLPVTRPGSKEGEPHALFAYNQTWGPEYPTEAYYNVFGDPEKILSMTEGNHGHGSSLRADTIERYKIPIVGREPRAAGMIPGVATEADAAAYKQSGFSDIPPADSSPPAEPPAGGSAPPPAGGAPAGSLPLEPPSPGYEPQSKFIREMVDSNQPIKYMEGREISPGFPEAGGDTTRSYNLAKTMTGRTYGVINQAMQGLDTTLAPLQNNAEYKAAEQILHYKNLMDLAAQGKETASVSVEDAGKELDKIRQAVGPQNFDRLSAVADDFSSKATDMKLQSLTESGLITPEKAAEFKTKYPHYVPSEVDLGLPDAGSPKQPAILGKVKTNFLKAKEGTSQAISTDSFSAVRRGMADAMAASEKQKVIDSVAGEFGKQVGGRTFEDGGIVRRVYPGKIPPGYVESSIKTSDGRIVAVHKDVEDLLQGLDRQQADLVTRAMANYNRIFREGATLYRAPFVLNHAFRSFENAVMTNRQVTGQGAMIPAMVKGVIASVSDTLGMPNELFKSFERSGGAYGGLYNSITSESRLPFRLASPLQKAGRVFTAPFDMLGKMVRLSDNIMRVSEFARLPSEMPDILKASNARNVGVDFSQAGNSMRLLSKWIPFSNDKIQAGANFLATARAQPLTTVGRVAAFIGIPTAATYFWNKQFPENDLIDVPTRQHYFYMIQPDAEKSKAAGHLVAKTIDNNGRLVPVFWRVAKIGPVRYFSNAIDAYLNHADHSPATSQIDKSYGPARLAGETVGEVTPPALKVPIEQKANYQFWSDHPIVSERNQGMLPQHQFDSGTSNTERLLGQATGTSPVRIAHAVRGVFPAAGTGMEASDLALKGINNLRGRMGKAPIEPEIPRQDQSGFFKSREIQPFLSAPSGFSSIQEQNAKDFEAQAQLEKHDPAGMAERSLQAYVQNPTQENLSRTDQWMSQIDGRQRSAIIRKINLQMAQQGMSPEDRAMTSAPKNIRARLYDAMQKR